VRAYRDGKQFLGHVVQRVRYCEVAYESGAPAWCDDPRFDSLDYGLDLLTASGERFAFSWSAEFYMYGVSLETGLPEASERTRVWNVSEMVVRSTSPPLM
jgi:hypothetical protein